MIIYEEYIAKIVCKDVYVCLGGWIVFIAIRIVLNFMCMMFWYPTSLANICMFVCCYILDPITMCPS